MCHGLLGHLGHKVSKPSFVEFRYICSMLQEKYQSDYNTDTGTLIPAGVAAQANPAAGSIASGRLQKST